MHRALFCSGSATVEDGGSACPVPRGRAGGRCGGRGAGQLQPRPGGARTGGIHPVDTSPNWGSTENRTTAVSELLLSAGEAGGGAEEGRGGGPALGHRDRGGGSRAAVLPSGVRQPGRASNTGPPLD